MTDVKDFDALATGWDANPRIRETARVFVSHILQHVPLPPRAEALEFGCGTGQAGLQLASLLHRIAMVDASEGMLTVLRQKIDHAAIRNLHIHCGDFLRMDFGLRQFDLIYSLMAMHHVQDIPAILAHTFALLKPGGFFCVGDLEPENGSFHGGSMDVQRGFDPRLLGNQLRSCGFADVYAKRMMVIEKADARGIPKTYPLFFMMAQKP